MLKTILFEHALCQVAPKSGLAVNKDGFLIGQLIDTLPQFVYRYIDGIIDMSGQKFGLCSYIEQNIANGYFVKLIPIKDIQQIVQNILGYKAGHVHRVFRR